MKTKVKQINTNPLLVLIDGPMGTGKTTVSKLLNEKIEGSARVGLDDVKRFVSGNEKKNKLGQAMVMAITNEYLRRGIIVIVEWAMKKEHVEIFKKIAKKNHARFFVYQLDAPKHLLIKRIKERTRVLLNKTKLPKTNIKNVERHFESHYTFHVENKYNDATILNSQKLSTNKITNLILKDIKNIT